MRRRDFLKTAAISGGALLTGGLASAGTLKSAQDVFNEMASVLVDTTRCIGCRSCEEACAEAHGLPVPDIDDESVFERHRKTDPNHWTVVNRYETEKGTVYAKKQCMHCNQPACASACLVKAMYKTPEGPVIWRGNKCMGCRYCMISCPFDIPKFEYDSPNPRIRKCIMCYERLEKGEQPACVEACPEEAIVFGKRGELLEEAKRRIYNNPDKYVHHVYGEHEVGGTGWLYLAAVPFEQLGFPTNVGTRPYPELTKEFLYGVSLVLLIWPAFLLGISHARREEVKKEEVKKAK